MADSSKSLGRGLGGSSQGAQRRSQELRPDRPLSAGKTVPTPQALAEVRALDAKTYALNIYCRLPDVAAQRWSLYRLDPPLPVRRATEAEIVEAALALDAGQLLNPRLWMERLTVRAAQVRAA